MAIWNNRIDSSVTSWGQKAGTSGGSSLLGDFDQSAYNEGQYTSSSEASSGLVGTKYFLLDDKEFNFGTDTDFRIAYNSTDELFEFKSRMFDNSYDNGYQDNVALAITKKGYLKLRDQGTISLPTTSNTGQIAFTNNKIFISLN
tara:strand:- start:487 stop:918 length:432 start_codon:yes stop_codon:yes gene_type:complete